MLEAGEVASLAELARRLGGARSWVIESPTAGVRLRTRRVTNWQGGGMILRWAAAACLETEKSFRRIIGYQEPWALKAVLEENQEQQEVMVA